VEQERYFDDVEPGDEFEEAWTPTKEHVLEYLAVGNPSLATQGRFTDQGSAEELQLARPIVPGTMSLAILTRLVTDWMGAHGKLHHIDVNFRRPVHHEDNLRVLALVTDTHEEDNRPTVKLDVYFENERGERPLQGVAVVELPRRP
jgi:acyl dehydratase